MIIPDFVWMQAVTSVQQPCSNPSKYPETPGKATTQKYGYFQVLCKLQKPLENYLAAFTRQRSLVRSQHRPLAKSRFLQRKRQPEVWARTSDWPYLPQKYIKPPEQRNASTKSATDESVNFSACGKI